MDELLSVLLDHLITISLVEAFLEKIRALHLDLMESQADQGLNVRLCVENIFFIINIGIIFPQGHSFSILLVLDLVPNVAGNVVTARLKLPLNREDLI